MVTNGEHEELVERLRNLGYEESLDKDNASLVSHLLSDLTHITETCQLLQEQLAEVDSEASEIQKRNLRAEISKLTAENNQLHNELVLRSDRCEELQREMFRIKKEHTIELENIRFMTSQYNLKLQEEREKTRAEQRKLEDFLIRNRVLEKKSTGMTMYPARIALTSEIEATETKVLSHPDPVDPHMVDLMQLSERRIQQLVNEKNRVQNSNRELQNTISTLKDRIEAREKEIARLGITLEKEKAEASFLDSDNNTSTISKNEKTKQLELQIECLQEHILELEYDLKQERDGKTSEDTQLNEFKNGRGMLSQSLVKLENLLDQLGNSQEWLKEKDNHNTSSEASLDTIEKTIIRATKSLMSMESKLQESETLQHKLTAQLTEAKKDVENLQNDLLSLGKPTDNKKREPIKPLSRLEAQQKALEKQIRDLTLKVHNLEVRKMALEKDLRTLHKKANAEKNEEKTSLQHKEVQAGGQTESANLSNEEEFESRIKSLEQEKMELTRNLETTSKELSLTQRERADLISAMKQFEEQLKTIQEHISALTTEKENLRALYEQTSKELRSLRKNIKKQAQIGSDGNGSGDSNSSLSNHSSSSYRSVPSSRQDDLEMGSQKDHTKTLDRELKLTKQENITFKSLISQLEKSINEKNQQIEQLRSEISQIKQENSSLQEAYQKLDKDNTDNSKQAALESQIRSLEGSLASARDEMDKANDIHNAAERKLKDKIESLQKQAHDLSTQLQQSHKEHSDSLKEVNNQLSDLQQENQRMSRNVSLLEKEKSRLTSALKEKDQQYVTLNDLIHTQNVDQDRLNESYRKLTIEHEKLDRALKQSIDENQKLRLELSNCDNQLQALRKQLDEHSIEYKQHQVDLQAYKRQSEQLMISLASAEKQLRSTELDKSNLLRELSTLRDLHITIEKSKDELKRQLVRATTEVTQQRNTLRRLEIENNALVAQINANNTKSDRLDQILRNERKLS